MPTFICEICSKEFIVKRARKAVVRFCSRTCQGAWQSKTRTGENSSRWQGGKVNITCIICGTVFQADPNKKMSRKYCSQECYHSSRVKHVINICQQCGCEFARKKKMMFCSRKCHHESMKNKEVVVCQECGTEFEAIPFNIARGNAKYCSRNCKDKAQGKKTAGKDSHLWRGGLISRICETCGCTFEIFPSAIRREGYGRFCSSECQYKGLSGPLSPYWKGGPRKYPAEFNKQLKERIKIRDEGRCCLCHSKKRLQIHHIDYDSYNNDERNLITLCVSCHAKTNHGRQEDWMEKLGFLLEYWYLDNA